jgi:YfiR/HmsC-like
MRRLWSFALLWTGLLISIHAPVFAEVSKEYQLKAVFLWRLAQFTEWPSDGFASGNSPIVICIVGENPFDNALSAAVAGETAHGRRLVVQQHRTTEQAKSCHVIYFPAAPPRGAAILSGRSVLTVRDDDRPASGYETIVTFVTEQNRIKLRINVKAAAAAGLVLDPRLLRAAEIVGD